MANWKCAAARSLPINTERSWDVDAARERVFEWAGSDSSATKYRRAFLAYDSDEPDQEDSYKLLFADVVDGRLTAIAAGLRHAASLLPRTASLSESCQSTVRSVMDSYVSLIHDENASDEEKSANGILLSRWSLDQRAARQPTVREELPEELLSHVHDPSILEDEALPYVTRAWASTDLVDTYHTRMRASSLKNFANEATAGISIQNSHRVHEQALGRTFKGVYRAGRGEVPSRTEVDFYIPRNIQVSDTRTNDLISAIRWGTAHDVSVGFYGGGIRCSMCDKPMMSDLMSLLFFGGDDDSQEIRDPSSPCHHLPGVEYDMRDADGRKTGDRQVAVGEIDGAHLAELSIVFEGATPSAQITGRRSVGLDKAIRMMELDVLSPRVAQAIEGQFRGVRFGLNNRYFNGVDVRAKKKLPPWMDDKDEDEQDDSGDSGDTDDEDKKKKKRSRKIEAGERIEDASSDRDVEIEVENNHLGGIGVVAESEMRTEPEESDGTEEEVRSKETEVMPEAPAAEPTEAGVRAALISAGLAPDGFQGDLATRFRELGRELTDLREWADVGREARETLIDETRRAGVRAYGAPNFKEAAYAPILQRGSWKEILALREHFDEVGSQRFKVGRQTIDSTEEDRAKDEQNGYREIKLLLGHIGRKEG